MSMSKRAAKNVSLALLIVCICLLTVIIIPAWINNVSITLQWDPEIPGKEYRGILPWYDWTAVDFSTVTIIIPLIGLLFLSRSLYHVLKPHSDLASEYIPFPPQHMRWTVANGLMGTIVGLLMYCYYKQSEAKIDDLLNCLKTALFSTLMALLWVCYVVLPSTPIIRKLYNVTSEAKDTKDSGLIEQLNSLSSTVAKVEGHLESLDGTLAKATETFVHHFESAGTALTAFEQSLPLITSSVSALQETATIQQRVGTTQEKAAEKQASANHALELFAHEVHTMIGNARTIFETDASLWKQQAKQQAKTLAKLRKMIFEGDGYADKSSA